eukprot:766211-Hanusia_phi.AAC.3
MSGEGRQGNIFSDLRVSDESRLLLDRGCILSGDLDPIESEGNARHADDLLEGSYIPFVEGVQQIDHPLPGCTLPAQDDTRQSQEHVSCLQAL